MTVRSNIGAHTNLEPLYPSFISIYKMDDGNVEIIVRGAPTKECVVIDGKESKIITPGETVHLTLTEHLARALFTETLANLK